MNKYKQWYEKQNKTTQEWLDSQPIWHNSDMIVGVITGSVLGLLIGLLF